MKDTELISDQPLLDVSPGQNTALNLLPVMRAVTCQERLRLTNSKLASLGSIISLSLCIEKRLKSNSVFSHLCYIGMENKCMLVLVHTNYLISVV